MISRRNSQPRSIVAAYALAALGAALIGLAADHLWLVILAIATTLPAFSHARHVGLPNAVTQPTAMTIIVGFYLLLFPLRGAVIAASGYRDVLFLRSPVTSSNLVSLLLLASLSTTAMIEAFYFRHGRGRVQPPPPSRPAPEHEAVVRLAFLLCGISVLALLGVVSYYGGVAGAKSAHFNHNVTAGLQGDVGGPGGSAWALFAVPCVWVCAYAIFNVGTPRRARQTFVASTVLILAAELYIYGSRLGATLALIGLWVVYYYSGRRFPAKVVLLAIPVGLLISQAIIQDRIGLDNRPLSNFERYSRTAGYGVLDIALLVRNQPEQVRGQLRNPTRWTNTPAYFVPSFVWPGRPNLLQQRLGLYVANDYGTRADQGSGFPTTLVIEGWLLGGWLGAITLAAAFGLALGWAARRLVGGTSRPPPAAVLAYCFVVTGAWTYYKDGDMVVTFVGEARTAVYLLGLLWLTGVVGRRPQPRVRVPRSGIRGVDIAPR